MKLLLALTIFIAATTISSAAEKAYHFGAVLDKYVSLDKTNHLDLTNFNKTLISGRCFSNSSQFAFGGAIALVTVTTDSGPIGSPDEKVNMGTYLSSLNPNQFDDVSFSQVATGPDAVEFSESFQNLTENASYIRNIALRQDTDGIIYGLEYFTGSGTIRRACYFYKNNN